MTFLIAGSVVLILASAATLVLGWTDQNESLIWASIVLSVAAAVALALAYVRSKRELARAANSAPPEASRWSLAAGPASSFPRDEPKAAGGAAPVSTIFREPAVAEPPPSVEPPAAERPTSEEPHAEPVTEETGVEPDAGAEPLAAEAPAAEPPARADKGADAARGAGSGVTSAGASPAGRRAASKPARKAPSSAEVVAFAERKKYHRPECRYAKAAGGERITKAQARRRSYSACGICKP